MATLDTGATRTNFAHLEAHDEQLVRFGMLAERYFAEDPNTALLKLRQLAELLAQLVATKVGLYTSCEEAQYDLLRRLQDQGILPREVAQLFGEVRRAGNAASRAIVGDHRTALVVLKITCQLGIWFHRTFANAAFKSGPFVPPSPPKNESDELRAELAALAKALGEHQAAHQEAAAQLASTEAKLRDSKDEQPFWEQMAVEAEQAKTALAQKLATEQAEGALRPKAAVTAFVTAATTAATVVELDEADTRKLIDEQLREVGWTVDSARLSYAKGARPEKGKNLAIAEWPTSSGPADYVLFVGLMPIGAVEAKRKNIDVSGALQQAKRYSRTFQAGDQLLSPGGPWREFQIPFVFSSYGRPYLRQLATRSGTWFCDLRNPDVKAVVRSGRRPRFNEGGACGPHADADQFTELRVTTTTARLNLNQGRIKKARQRVWARRWQLIEDFRTLTQQLNQAAGPADRERLNQKKEELRRMARPESEFSAVAKNCLVKSNIGWVRTLAAG